MHKSIKALLLFFTALTISLFVMGLLQQTSATISDGRQRMDNESQFPIAEENAPEPSAPTEQIKRNRKEKKYERYKDKIGPGVTVAIAHYHWPPGFPTLPVAQSDAVIIGEVLDAKAFQTSDKTAVYSEFTVRISEVLKNDAQTQLSPGSPIITERPGGRVRYSSGHISRFSLSGWGMPRPKRQYVLFLSRNEQEEGYRIVTGYELRGGRVFPLDMTTSSDTDFDAYINTDASSLMAQLRAAVAKSSIPQLQ